MHTMNAGTSIAGTIAQHPPRWSSRPSIAGPPPPPRRVVSINNIAITGTAAAAGDKNKNKNKNRKARSSNSTTVVVTTSNIEMNNSNNSNSDSNSKKRQFHTISPTATATTATATATTNSVSTNNDNDNDNDNKEEQQRIEQQQEQQQQQQQIQNQKRRKLLLQSIHPTDYAKAGFKANGYKDLDIITEESIKRFIPKPTQEMIDAYSTDIVMAVRTNNVQKARELYTNTNTNKTGTGTGTGTGSTFLHGCNACNRFGESILHIACRRGHLEMVKFLIEEVGLRIETIRDDYHRTPLHDAFWTPIASYDVVDFLLRQPNVVQLLLLKDVRGYTPLDYARSEDRGKWLRFLWERKAILRIPTPTKNEQQTTAGDVIQVHA